ncbi:HCO3 transporter family-domain-containing protein [Flagelloscypha sp. PMI_526]|nr:HCO3 transporter family-domain-containing protein [Flagelloscypha sp. PMI_526]
MASSLGLEEFPEVSPTPNETTVVAGDSRPPTPPTQNSIKKHGLVRWVKNLGGGMLLDIRSRGPYYISDWRDAWNYRVVPATALIFFANVLPGIAFSLDLIETTQQYGVSEVLLSSFMAAFIFSVFGAQPLTIAGVTGPITVFNKTIYDILNRERCNFLRYVTIFSCDTFGFYVSWVYLQYGIQVITRNMNSPDSTMEGSFVSIILAILMLVVSFLFQSLSKKTFFHRHVRIFLADYGMPISLIATSAMAYWGRFNAANPTTLPVGGAFQAAGRREWLVRFWELDGKWVGIALPFGIILWILFFFDHNVSSLMAQGSEFPLKKPPGFHWDFFLLGITTFIAGLIGVPAPNGLIPQAPIHTTSLVVHGRLTKKNDEELGVDEKGEKDQQSREHVPIGVVEQRVSNLSQGALCIVLLTGPFLHILGLIPRGVLAGLFWYMGADALNGSGITNLIYYFLRDKHLTPPDEPLRKVRKSRILMYLSVQLVGFGATFAITQTIAAIGFPVIIMLLIPVRMWVIPRMPFTEEELSILDRPTASPFTMESVGGVKI